MRIKVTTSFPHWPLVKQTPGGKGVWKGIEFRVDDDTAECDGWFVIEGLPDSVAADCPPENVVFVTAEPPHFKRYDRAWMKRHFRHVLSSQHRIDHPGRVVTQTGLPWLIEPGYDELKESALGEKTQAISVICSSKRTTRGHRQRLAFLRELKEQCPELRWYGRGISELEKKWEGLAPFRYSLAIENGCFPDYWTEKVADCFLAGTVPLYAGCPNLADYFPAEAFETIDMKNPGACAEKIRALIESDDFARRQPALREARERVLDRYNVFNLMAEFAIENFGEGKRESVRLEPEPQPGKWGRRFEKWRKRYLT